MSRCLSKGSRLRGKPPAPLHASHAEVPRRLPAQRCSPVCYFLTPGFRAAPSRAFFTSQTQAPINDQDSQKPFGTLTSREGKFVKTCWKACKRKRRRKEGPSRGGACCQNEIERKHNQRAPEDVTDWNCGNRLQ